jgi:MoaA/NifB/PqqE/SkfB family radical SAM enzyme
MLPYLEFSNNTIDMSKPTVERKISWRVTRFCNLHCLHCLAGHGNRRRRDLVVSECRQVLRSVLDAGVTRITWTGGEPTLLHELPALLQVAHAADVSSVLTTHGLTMREEVLDALDQRLDRLRISFDGLQMTHDRIRGGPFFAKALAAGERAVLRGLRVEANVSILGDNVGEIPELINVLSTRGFSRIVLLTLTSRESAVDNRIAEARPEEIDALLETLQGVVRRGNTAAIQLNRYSSERDSYAVIESDGEILLCSETSDDISFGSALGGEAAMRIAAAVSAQTLEHRELVE